MAGEANVIGHRVNGLRQFVQYDLGITFELSAATIKHRPIFFVDDLDNGRIAREGFDEFSFTWQAVSQLLDVRPPERETAAP